MFFHPYEFRRSLELTVLFFEPNIFISKCFIISHINVRSILETYVTRGNCLTNTLKIWPKFKLYFGARDKQKNIIFKTAYFLSSASFLCGPFTLSVASWELKWVFPPQLRFSLLSLS